MRRGQKEGLLKIYILEYFVRKRSAKILALSPSSGCHQHRLRSNFDQSESSIWAITRENHFCELVTREKNKADRKTLADASVRMII